MAASLGGEEKGAKQHNIVDDFMYGSNVAGAHVYVRLAFLRKVYGILTCQLIVTTVFSIACLAFEPVKSFVQSNQWMVLVAAFTSLGLLFALAVKSREFPTNFILLIAFTLCESVLIGTVVTFYDTVVVIEAFALTMTVTIALTLYTMQSKRDFSSWGAALFSVLCILIIAGIMQIFIQNKVMDMAIAAGGAVLFSLFIIFDTHMIMHKVSPEEYIHASVNLYLDIINLFLHLLRLLGERRS